MIELTVSRVDNPHYIELWNQKTGNRSHVSKQSMYYRLLPRPPLVGEDLVCQPLSGNKIRIIGYKTKTDYVAIEVSEWVVKNVEYDPQYQETWVTVSPVVPDSCIKYARFDPKFIKNLGPPPVIGDLIVAGWIGRYLIPIGYSCEFDPK